MSTYNLVDPATGQVVGTVTMGASGNTPAPTPPGFSTNVPVQTLERGGEADFPAGVTGAVAVHHAGGVLEMKLEAVRGQGFFNTLTEQMVGPVGFDQRTVAPAGTTGQHTIVAEDRPAGTYTYYVQASPACPLRIFLVQ